MYKFPIKVSGAFTACYGYYNTHLIPVNSLSPMYVQIKNCRLFTQFNVLYLILSKIFQIYGSYVDIRVKKLENHLPAR